MDVCLNHWELMMDSKSWRDSAKRFWRTQIDAASEKEIGITNLTVVLKQNLVILTQSRTEDDHVYRIETMDPHPSLWPKSTNIDYLHSTRRTWGLSLCNISMLKIKSLRKWIHGKSCLIDPDGLLTGSYNVCLTGDIPPWTYSQNLPEKAARKATAHW